MGDEELKKKCFALKDMNHKQPVPVIFIFDRDNDKIVREMDDEENGFRDWGNNVFSIVIPVPEHRTEDSISIEYYYQDADLFRPDQNGRRLFLSSEFNPKTGRHIKLPELNISQIGLLQKPRIIDNSVFDINSQSKALTKDDFASHILERTAPFDQVDFSAFVKITTLLSVIIDRTLPRYDVLFSGTQDFKTELASIPQEEQVVLTLERIIDLCKFACTLFCAVVVRFYEQPLIDIPRGDLRKKVLPIREILEQGFRNPTLRTLQDLSRHCFYLIDQSAPLELSTFHACMADHATLGKLGDFLELLERLVPPASGILTKNRAQQRKRFLLDVIPELARYENKLQELRQAAQDKQLNGQAHLTVLCLAVIDQFAEVLAPLTSFTFVSSSIVKASSGGETFFVLRKTFSKHELLTDNTEEPASDTLAERCEILLSTSHAKTLDLTPFCLIREDKLCAYRRTRVTGYDYKAPFDKFIHLYPTKVKFNHAVFKNTKLGDEQSLFWTGVVPELNPNNKVKANIPIDFSTQFVGRTKEIKAIIDDVIEIPNMNAIIFGIGGIGKTSLMIQLTRQLFDEPEPDNVLYNNIVWVSAKADYYNPIFNVVEKKKRQFKSLEAILDATFEFFEYSNMSEYDLEDKKILFVELIRESTILLIVDNFETVPKTEQEQILQFFDNEVKRSLKKSPNRFKLIVTSREQIPSGFRQIPLQGLPDKEASNLMDNLYSTYQHAKQPLPDDLKKKLNDVSKGIPIILRHCFAQIYEHNRAVDSVIQRLSHHANKLVDFSFEEIIQILKKDDLSLRTLILLKIQKVPLSLRQITDILECSDLPLQKCLSTLAAFQCVTSELTINGEFYRINPEVDLLMTRLLQTEQDLFDQIKMLINKNYTLERRMQYTHDEKQIIEIFTTYLSQENFLQAEDFMRDKLKEYPASVALNYYYAKYLNDAKRETARAIEVLENIRESSGNSPAILKLLVKYYIAQTPPNFASANVYVNELEKLNDDDTLTDLAEFYVNWSTNIRMRVDPDPIRELTRREEYKRLADQAIEFLQLIKIPNHRHRYLLAQSYYNKWDTEKAITLIDQAIDSAKEDPYTRSSYLTFRAEVISKQQFYRRRER